MPKFALADLQDVMRTWPSGNTTEELMKQYHAGIRDANRMLNR